MPGYTTTYRYTVERHPKEDEAASNWVWNKNIVQVSKLKTPNEQYLEAWSSKMKEKNKI